jgi:hypothetical protein
MQTVTGSSSTGQNVIIAMSGIAKVIDYIRRRKIK